MKKNLYIIFLAIIFTIIIGHYQAVNAANINVKNLKVATIDQNKEYYILSSLMKTRAVGTAGSSINNATNILVSTISGADAQKFKFIKNSDGSYRITNSKSGRVLDVYAGATNRRGTNVWLYNSNGTKAQKWYPVKNSDNTYTFYTPDGTVLDIYAGSTANNANIQIYDSNGTKAQKFILKDASTLKPANIATDKVLYIFTKKDSSKALDIYASSKADFANLDLYSFNKTGAQQFKFQKNNDSTYTIKNNNSNKVLHITGNGSSNGTNVVQYSSINSSAQKWYALQNYSYNSNNQATANGITFISKETGKALNLNNSSTANLTNINIWDWNESDSQKWIVSDQSNVKLNKSSIVLNLLGSTTETLTASPTGSYEWTSSNPQVATVNKSTGKVTAKSMGTCVITAKNKSNGKKATCKVEVISIEFTEDTASKMIVKVGGKVSISVRTAKNTEKPSQPASDQSSNSKDETTVTPVNSPENSESNTPEVTEILDTSDTTDTSANSPENAESNNSETTEISNNSDETTVTFVNPSENTEINNSETTDVSNTSDETTVTPVNSPENSESNNPESTEISNNSEETTVTFVNPSENTETSSSETNEIPNTSDETKNNELENLSKLDDDSMLNEELVGVSSEINYKVVKGDSKIIKQSGISVQEPSVIESEFETKGTGKVTIEIRNRNSSVGITKEITIIDDYFTESMVKNAKATLISKNAGTQIQGLDISASECVLYSIMDSYTYDKTRVAVWNSKENRISSEMYFYNFGHGSGFDAEQTVVYPTGKKPITKYTLWTESVGCGSSSNYAISRINYIPNSGFNTYNVATGKVTVHSSNKSDYVIKNNPIPSKFNGISNYVYQTNENYVYYDEKTKEYWKSIKVAVDEANRKILLYHYQNFYVYNMDDLNNLKTETFKGIPVNTTYYINNQAYNNVKVDIEAKNIAKISKDKVTTFSAKQTTTDNQKTFSYSWQGVAIDGNYVYLLEGHRPYGTDSTSSAVTGKAFISVFDIKTKSIITRYEVPNISSTAMQNNLSADGKSTYKYKIEVEGIKIKKINGKKYLYIGITGLTNTKTGQNDIGAIKYDLY